MEMAMISETLEKDLAVGERSSTSLFNDFDLPKKGVVPERRTVYPAAQNPTTITGKLWEKFHEVLSKPVFGLSTFETRKTSLDLNAMTKHWKTEQQPSQYSWFFAFNLRVLFRLRSTSEKVMS